MTACFRELNNDAIAIRLCYMGLWKGRRETHSTPLVYKDLAGLFQGERDAGGRMHTASYLHFPLLLKDGPFTSNLYPSRILFSLGFSLLQRLVTSRRVFAFWNTSFYPGKAAENELCFFTKEKKKSLYCFPVPDTEVFCHGLLGIICNFNELWLVKKWFLM